MKSFHFQSDHRQIGGLLMLLSFGAMINAIGGLVSAFGPDGAVITDPVTIEFWMMIFNLTTFIWGTVGGIVGYMACVHDWSHSHLNIFMMIAIQAAWIGYITAMIAAGKGAALPVEENQFVPLVYGPTTAEVKFIGAMGVLGVFCYGIGFVGSVAFMVWSLHAYTTNNPGTRSGDYYKGRMCMYSGILALAGLVQFLLGVVSRARYGQGPLEDGPITVVFFNITYPGINIAVGLFQVINGLWGIARVYGLGVISNNFMYQVSLMVQWLCVLLLQDVVTFAYNGASNGGAAPAIAAFFLPLTLMPAFLDSKHMKLPATFDEDYYDPLDDEKSDNGESEKKDEEAKPLPESAVTE